MPRTKKKASPEKPISVSVKHERVNGHMVIITTETFDAILNYSDIFAKCTIEPDNDMGPPWEEHDGWEHRLVDLDENLISNPKDVASAFMNYRSRWKMIVIDRKILEQWQGKYGQYGPNGESRQAYEDRLIACRREAIKALKNWYVNGYVWYCVGCEFLGHAFYLGGIQTEDDSPYDPYLDECKADMAAEVITELEAEGWTVINQPSGPTPEELQAQKLNNFRDHLARDLGFKDYWAYRQWVESRPEEARTWQRN